MTDLTFQNIHKPPTSKGWMLCFHHVGGSHLDYLFLRQLRNIEVWIAELPGRDLQTLAESVQVNVTSWLAEIIAFVNDTSKQGTRLGCLFGFSLGAQMAFQAGRTLGYSWLRKAVYKIFVASALAPVQFVAHDISHFLSANNNWLAREFGLLARDEPSQNLNNLKEKMIDRLRFDYRVYQSWQTLPVEVIDIPMIGFFGEDDPLIDGNTIELWAQATNLDFKYSLLDGGHFFTPKSRENLVTLISNELLSNQ